jgi:glycolate oxidase iron-sulfur subunit
MQTQLAPQFRGTADGEEAEAILRACVHCGFCTATCPTYQLLGDELDGPRGRIYLIKQVLEGAEPTRKTQLHLDRCLTCRNCETTCPSGVRYGRLVDIGRKLVEARVERPASERLLRGLMKEALTRPWVFAPAYRAGQALRPVLPRFLREKIQPKKATPQEPAQAPTLPPQRRMLVLEGCVQPAMSPSINAAASRVLARLGIELVAVPRAECCGALRFHMNDQEGGLADMRRTIDACWPLLEGAEALVMTASGCGVTVKEYGHLLAHDPGYADKARHISSLTRDLSEILAPLAPRLAQLAAKRGHENETVAYHPPCSLQHGQQLRGQVEAVLAAVGVQARLPNESHLCCGSAGTYSLLQPQLAQGLRDRKLANLQATGAASVVSANIGCIAHLQGGTSTPVEHWIELVDRRLQAAA